MLPSVGDKNAFAGICTLSEYFPSMNVSLRLFSYTVFCIIVLTLSFVCPFPTQQIRYRRGSTRNIPSHVVQLIK